MNNDFLLIEIITFGSIVFLALGPAIFRVTRKRTSK